MHARRRAIAALPALLPLLLACLLMAAPPASAQLVPGLTGGGSESAAAEGEGKADAQYEIESLIRVLKDEAARQALIEQLEKAEKGEEKAAQEAPPPDPPIRSLGRQAADITRTAANGLAEAAESAYGIIAAAPERLDGLQAAADPAVLFDAAEELLLAILVTYAVFILLRLAARPLRRRLAAAGEGSAFLRTLLLSLAVALLDAATVLAAWAAGYALVAFAIGSTGEVSLHQSLYLNAFVAVEIARIIIRLVMRPETGALRLFPAPDAGARYLARRLTLVAGVLGYGLLLAVPIVNEEAGGNAGQPLGTAISLLVILWAFVAVIRHRRAVAAWLTPEETESRRIFAVLARLWHWPMLGYLAFLFAIVLARPGGILIPVLEASGQILLAVVIGIMVNASLARWARAGVALPERVSSTLPLLEQRVNGFVPKALLVVRIIVMLTVTAIAVNVAGVFDINGWMDSDLGLRLTGGMVTVLLILLAAFVLWVGFMSWVDWRLNPDVGRVPTAREATLLSLLRNAATILLAIITMMFALSELGIDIAPLIASAGVLGLAIGFGAQKLVQDVITGVFIQLENAMNVGDVVTVNGTTGGVEKLTVRSVSLRDLHGVFHLIPFSSVDMVANYMKEFSYSVCDMGIAYREDIGEARQAMHDAFDALQADDAFASQILSKLEWFGLNEFGDSAVVLRARIKTLPGKQWGVGREYNAHLKRIFDERAIEIPFPHQTIYFGEDKAGKAPPLHMVRDDAPAEDAETVGQEQGSQADGEDHPEQTLHRRTVDMPDVDEGH